MPIVLFGIQSAKVGIRIAQPQHESLIYNVCCDMRCDTSLFPDDPIIGAGKLNIQEYAFQQLNHGWLVDCVGGWRRRRVMTVMMVMM